MRAERFDLCGRILDEGGWPLELIDVETLLDEDTTVIHYLGPRDLDLALLRARFRSTSGFDVVFEPAGFDPGAGPAVPDPSPGEGPRGGAGIATAPEADAGRSPTRLPPSRMPDHGPPASRRILDGRSAHHACSSCGIAKLLTGKRSPRD